MYFLTKKYRQKQQNIMIDDNLIETLIEILEKNELLSDYSLEYAIALLMNLTLKEQGKQKCSKIHKKTLKVVSELLGNSNPEVLIFLFL